MTPIRALTPADAPAVLALFQAAAAAPDSGLARRPDEIDESYARAFILPPGDGLTLGAVDGEAVIGAIHAVRPRPRQFAHNLWDLTVAVHPDRQGEGLGSRLFAALIEAAHRLDPPVRRIELFVREGNAGAVRLYERLGFRVEGRFPGRVRLGDTLFEDDLAMALGLETSVAGLS